MEQWKRIAILLCLYGFFKEYRPSEAFLTPFLKGPEFKNLTENEVNNQIYPVSTYATLVCLAFVLLFSDAVRQKPVLVVGGVAYVATFALLAWTEGVLWMQVMQMTYGLAVASEIAYYSYIYFLIHVDRYKKVTSVVRVSVLIGRFFSGVTSQLLVSLHLMDYLELDYISLASVCVAFLLSLVLPIPRKIDADVVEDAPEEAADDTTHLVETERFSCRTAVKKKWAAFKEEMTTLLLTVKCTYSDFNLLKWSLWWAFATCGVYQVGNYGQNLWDEISPSRDNRKIYNGAVEAISTLLGE